MAFRVRHRTHSGSLISSHVPVGASLSYTFRAGGPGDISYTLALSEYDELHLKRDSFAAYKTDFLLQHRPQATIGAGWENIMGGIHVPVNLKNDEDVIHVAGKDWAHWLEQPVWFDYYDYNYSQAGSSFATRRRDIIKADRDYSAGIYENIALLAFTPPATQSQICTKLIQNTYRGPNYPKIAPKYNDGAGSDQLVTSAYIINFQDTTTVLQHINNIAAMDEPWGFDWTMNPNKQMEFFGPRKNRRTSPTPIWTFTEASIIEHPMIELDWTGLGPIGTHVVGLSVGSPALWWHKRDQESVDKFREWLKIEHVGDHYIKGDDMRYAVDGLDFIHAQRDVKVIVNPEILFEGFKNHIGDVVRIRWDFPTYHEVNAFYWITEQTYDMPDPSNWRLTLGLQQIYDKV